MRNRKPQTAKRALCVAVCVALSATVSADEISLEAWGITGNSSMREVPNSANPMGWSNRSYVGGEIFGRVPVKSKWALIFRAGTEGASGKFAWKDFRTWTRGTLEGAATYTVFSLDRYSCGIQAGGGASIVLTGASSEHGFWAPPKAGVGVHCRDAKQGSWVNGRVLWDMVQGPGVGVELEAHANMFSKRTALGVVLVLSDVLRVTVVAKVRGFEWSQGEK